MFSQACWPKSQLLSGINRLAHKLGGGLENPNISLQNLEQYAESLGVEALPTQTIYGDLQKTLKRLTPGIVSINNDGKPVYIFLLKYTRNQLQLLLPDGRTYGCDLETLADAILQSHGYVPDPDAQKVLSDLGLHGKRLQRAKQLLTIQQLAPYPIQGLWLLRPNANQGLKAAAKHAHLSRYALGFAAAHLCERAALIAGVSLVGYAITQSLWTSSIVITWLLIMLSHWGFVALGQTCEVHLSIGAGLLIKRHLQIGALELSPEVHAEKGPAQLLGNAMEADGLQNNALPGFFAAINAAIDILIGLAIALFFQQWFVSGLILVFIVASSYPIVQFGRAYRVWAKRRTRLSHITIEHMQGNRTRLMQSGPDRWHKEEERHLHHYWLASVRMDKFALWLQTIIPGLWLISASAILCIAISLSLLSLTQLAALLGVILLVWQAWHGLADSCQQLARTWHSWLEIQDLLKHKASAQPIVAHTPIDLKTQSQLTANQLSYSYAGSKPVLQNINMHLQQGKQYLLQGESGSGKSTLLAILAGQANQQQGWLLCNDRDLQTLGHQYWRKKICWVPQYHDNYLFSATLLFNLLLGRTWPPSQEDMHEALAVCDKLGLTPLLEKMPAGILQSVGEMGWQLSQGERSRVFLARALLQKPDFLLLDESLGALDSSTSLRILDNLQTETSATLLCMHP